MAAETATYHTCYPTLFLVYIAREWYVSIRTNKRLGHFNKERKQHPPPGDDASTAGAAPGRVGRDEHGEVRQANTILNGASHLELGRLRLKSWSKSDFSIAETAWPTYLYMYLLLCLPSDIVSYMFHSDVMSRILQYCSSLSSPILLYYLCSKPTNPYQVLIVP